MTSTVRETVCTLSAPDDPEARRETEDLALVICSEARKRGWKTCAAWTEGNIQIRLQTASGGSARDLMKCFADEARDLGVAVFLLEDQEPATAICEFDDGPIAWDSVVQARLTRKFLYRLPEGAFLISNGQERGGFSVGRVGSMTERAEQWQSAQLAGMEGAMCRVLWAEEDIDAAQMGEQPIFQNSL